MGTGETTRRLLEAYPGRLGDRPRLQPARWSSALRETYDDVQLARMEDPLPDGPWDLVISVLSVHHLTDEQKQLLFRRVREQSKALVIGDVVKAEPQVTPIDPEHRLPRHRRGAGRVVRRRGRLGGRRPRGRPRDLRRGGAMSKVLYEKRDRIAYVTINRPEARNAIDPDVHRR